MFSQSLLNDSKQSIRLAAPLVGSRILHILNSFVNMILLASLGTTVVAASALIFSTTITLMFVALAMLYSVAVIVGKIYGTGNKEEIGQAATAGLLVCLLLGIFFMPLMWHIDKVLLLLHQPPELVALATPYFRIFSLGIIPSIGMTCFHEVAIGISRSRLVIIWDIFGTPLNIGLSYCLLFGKCGFPQLGIVGVAYSSSITYWLLFGGVALYFYYSKQYQSFKFFKFTKNSAKAIMGYAKKILLLGWPISVQLGAVSASYCFITYMMGWLGKPSLAAHHIANQLVTLVIMVPYGMAQASGVLVAQAVGSGRKVLSSLGYAGILVSLIVVAVGSILYWLIPNTLIALYIKDATNTHIIHTATILLAIMAIIQLTDTIGVVTTGALRGLHDTTAAMIVGIGANWMASIPLGYYLAFIMHLGAAGIYCGLVLGSLGSAILLLLRFTRLSTEHSP